MKPHPAEVEPDLPRKIGSYRIEDRLGSGGMGVVYRAFDEALQRPLAVKRLTHPNRPTASRRFRREAQAAARLNHPAIVLIYDVVETPEGDWIVMELVEGTPLGRLIRDGSLDLPYAVRLAREIAEGLAEAHAHGIIHRDLKSSNVMVTAAGHAKILDFGLAKLVDLERDADLSRSGIVLGTCHAMSPEQARGLPLDHRSDLFSFGSLVYEMLTATSPFRGGTADETLARICSFQQPPACRLRPEVPREISDLIDGLLSKEPEQRPWSAVEVAALLAEFETPGRGRARPGPLPATRPERGVESGDSPTQQSTIVAGASAQRSETDAGPASPAARPFSGSHPTSERRQVTVVCCELVGRDGPSGLPQAFDPEALHELMLQLRARAEVVVRRYDGQLGNSLGGHRMLVYFGYPQAHEDNAQRAVRAALELVDQAARMSDDSCPGRPVPLALRVGVHTGPAVVAVARGGEPVTLGTTLDLAVAVQSLAEPGCVIASPATCSLIEKSFALEALPPVEVPGLAAPLIPHRVLEPVESPEGSSTHLLPLVGRQAEMELLQSRWSLAREGNGQVILISGEAGIGKSRLVRALREHVDPDAVQWASCFGSPFAQSSPLQPVLGLLRQVLLRGEGTPLDRLESSLRDAGLLHAVPFLAPLLDVPLDGRHPALNLSPERQREKTLEALVALVLAMAERQPLVLLIEDLHWLDPTTRGWLDHLVDQVSSAPLLLLVTLRLQTVEALWESHAHLTRITLTPLRESEAERLIERVAGERSLPAAVRRQIVARTDGVPLFLEELTKAVLESHESGARQELPATLRDSLAARLDRLGSAKEVAQIAAVIGRTFSFGLLAAVCSSDEVALQRELRRLVQAELVYRKGIGGQTRYLFKHALVQDAAYDSLLRRERQKIHRRIAEALESRFPETAETTPEILAHHYTEAGLTEPAVDFWVRAGGLASRRSASAEVLSHLDRALRLLQGLAEGPERDRRELSIQNLRVFALIIGKGFHHPEIEQAHIRAEIVAERLGEAEEHFWAIVGLYVYYVNMGYLAQALPFAERLLHIAERERRPDLLSVAWVSLGIYHCWNSEYPAGVSAMERACELAPPDDHSFHGRTGVDLQVVALTYGAMAHWQMGHLDHARQWGERANARARQLGFPFTLAFAGVAAGAMLAQVMGDVETARRMAREMEDLSLEMGFSHWLWQTPFYLAWAELQAPVDGPPTVALGDFDSTQRVIVQMAGCAMAHVSCLHAEILILQGRFRDAWRALDEGLRLARERGVVSFTESFHLLRGEILLNAESDEGPWKEGGPAEAEVLFQMALEEARRNGSTSMALRAALRLGRLWKNQGRTEAARELVAQACDGFTGEPPSRDLREARDFLAS